MTKEPTASQFKLFKKYDKFWKSDFEALKKKCDDVNIEFISTPFDIEAATFLADLMDVFKISSSDLNNKPFIEFICTFGKPILLSTGASYLWEVEQAISWIEAKGNPVALLHCVLNYPTDDINANLAMILDLRRKYPEKLIGYSDHTMPRDMRILEVATLLGARIIEKHFTYDKTLPGNDHYHAMDKNDLKILNERLDTLLKLLGMHRKQPLPTEELARQNARRSLVAARLIPAGKPLEPEDITWKRPGKGIDPRDFDLLLGRTTKQAVVADTILQWGLFND